ncbi:MAG: hypothetical protein M1828_003544 [Chrysothrix sp. TS-e1954]|nr:MAG: hypothetical protein M1828_003544 [Chrysothrix sp. TS-e1954]
MPATRRPAPRALPHVVELSALDQIQNRSYMRLLLCFPFPNANAASEARNALKLGLARLLAKHPYLSGEVALNRQTKRLELRYATKNHLKRIDHILTFRRYHQAFTGADYQTLVAGGMPISRDDGKLLFTFHDLHNYDEPVVPFAVQANFIDGGLLLSVCLCPAVADGTGLMHLLHVFSLEIRTRGESVLGGSLMVNEGDREARSFLSLDQVGGETQALNDDESEQGIDAEPTEEPVDDPMEGLEEDCNEKSTKESMGQPQENPNEAPKEDPNLNSARELGDAQNRERDRLFEKHTDEKPEQDPDLKPAHDSNDAANKEREHLSDLIVPTESEPDDSSSSSDDKLPKCEEFNVLSYAQLKERMKYMPRKSGDIIVYKYPKQQNPKPPVWPNVTVTVFTLAIDKLEDLKEQLQIRQTGHSPRLTLHDTLMALLALSLANARVPDYDERVKLLKEPTPAPEGMDPLGARFYEMEQEAFIPPTARIAFPMNVRSRFNPTIPQSCTVNASVTAIAVIPLKVMLDPFLAPDYHGIEDGDPSTFNDRHAHAKAEKSTRQLAILAHIAGQIRAEATNTKGKRWTEAEVRKRITLVNATRNLLALTSTLRLKHDEEDPGLDLFISSLDSVVRAKSRTLFDAGIPGTAAPTSASTSASSTQQAPTYPSGPPDYIRHIPSPSSPSDHQGLAYILPRRVHKTKENSTEIRSHDGSGKGKGKVTTVETVVREKEEEVVEVQVQLEEVLMGRLRAEKGWMGCVVRTV